MNVHYARPDVLVTTAWVQEHLADPSIAIAEVNTDIQEGYAKGHVPGAVGWSLHEDLEHQTRRDVPTISQLEALLGRSGIDNGTTVVLYGDGNNRSATWAFWVLKYYRHNDVRLMDGGRAKWTVESRTLSTDVPTPAVKPYRAGRPDTTLRATKEHIVRNLGRETFRTLDTRTREEYLGEPASAPGAEAGIYRNGRIPGAVHVQWDDGATEDGSFRPAGELARMYAESGLRTDHEIIPYCRLGVRASYSWFVLKYLIGYERVRNYDGSWTEWGNATGVPIEKGE